MDGGGHFNLMAVRNKNIDENLRSVQIKYFCYMFWMPGDHYTLISIFQSIPAYFMNETNNFINGGVNPFLLIPVFS